MDNMTVKNGTKILINNRVYIVAAVVMHTLYVKVAPSYADYDFVEEQITTNYKIEFLNVKEK